jgi:hypothetical protein
MKVGEICTACGLEATEQSERDFGRSDLAIDPCLGRLPGVKYACCGQSSQHADVGYIVFDVLDGGEFAINMFPFLVKYRTPESTERYGEWIDIYEEPDYDNKAQERLDKRDAHEY